METKHFELAQDMVVPGHHCNNPAESIIVIDDVDSFHTKKWAASADRDYLKNWSKIQVQTNTSLERCELTSHPCQEQELHVYFCGTKLMIV